MSVNKNSGVVTTMNELGRSHVFITSTEDFDVVQSLDVPIEVNAKFLFKLFIINTN